MSMSSPLQQIAMHAGIAGVEIAGGHPGLVAVLPGAARFQVALVALERGAAAAFGDGLGRQ
jgi:hypothetical protein